VPWRLVLLRNSRVLARCDAKGELIVADGRVEVRYRPNDGRAYRAAVRNLVLVEESPILPGDACLEAVVMGEQKRKPARTKPAKGGAAVDRRARSNAHHTDEIIDAYTDGACSGNPGPAGSGVVIENADGRRELSVYLGRATNNVAELTAVQCALDAIGPTDQRVRVYTDSRYTIGVLSEGWTAKANQALIAQIKQALRAFPNLQLFYVAGHSGHPQNERADELARQAIRERASKTA
jgi:ribonuclease HI